METIMRGELLQRAALAHKNIILLGASLAYSWALASWWPAAVGLVGEVLWLGVGSATPAFRRWATAEAGLEARARRAAEAAHAARGLGAEYTQRVQALAGHLGQIAALARPRGLDRTIAGGAKLEALQKAFIQMATLHQQVRRFLGEGRDAQLASELAQLHQALTEERDPAARLTLRQAVGVAQRRQKQHEQLESTRRVLEAKMSTLELSLDYVRAQLFGGDVDLDLGSAVDQLLADASGLHELEAQTGAALSRLSGGTTGFHAAVGGGPRPT